MSRRAALTIVGLVVAALVPLEAQEHTEWIALGAKGGRSLVYSSAPLASRQAAITRALIVIPAGGRGAAPQFAMAVDVARGAGLLQTTLVVTPRIPSNDGYVCLDEVAEREINWGCQANNGWAAGGAASGDAALTSYDLVDAVLRRVADRRVFPNLRAVVVAGHSAGGQFTVRYAMSNRVHHSLAVPVSYVVANPAHYPYPDQGRPVADANVGCRIWNVWPYGLEDRVGYSARLTDAQLRTQLAARPVTYLLGSEDTDTGRGLDTTCAATAQGPHRLARGQNFARYINGKYAAKHSVVVVPGCGHDARCVFSAVEAAPVLFGLQR